MNRKQIIKPTPIKYRLFNHGSHVSEQYSEISATKIYQSLCSCGDSIPGTFRIRKEGLPLYVQNRLDEMPCKWADHEDVKLYVRVFREMLSDWKYRYFSKKSEQRAQKERDSFELFDLIQEETEEAC